MGRWLHFESQDMGRYLRVMMLGDFPTDPPAQAAFLKEAMRIASESTRKSFLIDLREMRHRLDVPEMFDYAVRTYPKQPTPERVALLDSAAHIGKTYFFETVMRNRGWDYRLFKAEAEAVNWLLDEGELR